MIHTIFTRGHFSSSKQIPKFRDFINSDLEWVETINARPAYSTIQYNTIVL